MSGLESSFTFFAPSLQKVATRWGVVAHGPYRESARVGQGRGRAGKPLAEALAGLCGAVLPLKEFPVSLSQLAGGDKKNG